MRNSLKAIFAVVLLLFYIVSNTPIEVFHQFVHAHDTAVAHTSKEEKDPCHRTIYHASRDNACAHAHLTKVKKCNLCNLIVHTDQLTVLTPSCQVSQSYAFYQTHAISARWGDVAIQLPSRAPPSLLA